MNIQFFNQKGEAFYQLVAKFRAEVLWQVIDTLFIDDGEKQQVVEEMSCFLND
ncbi:MAG: hypothetical protein K2M17_05385 [Bacilli bacterium]|nr:hypothetical protein [Bacilli bacterium]